MNTYNAYELGIYTSLSLPELPTARQPGDVAIRLGRIDIPFLQTGLNADRWIWADESNIFCHWDQIGTFQIQNGHEIIIDPTKDACTEKLRLALLGVVMGMLLLQRGLTVLHASAVKIKEHAIILVGNKGWGKSTTAAALHAQGNNLLADDVVAIRPTIGSYQVLPGPQQIKLWPDAVEAIGYTKVDLPKLYPGIEKRKYHPLAGYAHLAAPLKAIYLLDYGADVAEESVIISPVVGPNSLIELLPHWHGARFGETTLAQLGRVKHFQQCNELSQNIPVYRLTRPSSLSTLPSIAHAVEEHASSLQQPDLA